MRFLFVTLPHWAMGSVMLAGVAICSANVIARYFFGHAIFWAEEVMVFLAIWGVFLGLASATYQRAHLNMDLFSNSFAGRWRLFMNVLVAVGILACCVFMVIQSWSVVNLQLKAGAVSVSAGVPRWIPNAALLAGFALAALALLVRLRAYVTGRS